MSLDIINNFLAFRSKIKFEFLFTLKIVQQISAKSSLSWNWSWKKVDLFSNWFQIDKSCQRVQGDTQGNGENFDENRQVKAESSFVEKYRSDKSWYCQSTRKEYAVKRLERPVDDQVDDKSAEKLREPYAKVPPENPFVKLLTEEELDALEKWRILILMSQENVMIYSR